jgi:hypothetical protein
MTVPTMDRSAIEELFQLQRRSAIELMQHAGAVGSKGKPLLVERTSLLRWVETTVQKEMWRLERQRSRAEELSRNVSEVQAVREALTREGRPPTSFPLVQEVFQSSCSSLPNNIVIESGTITIRAEGDNLAEHACQLLYELGRAIANDYDGFEKRLSEALTPSGASSIQSC